MPPTTTNPSRLHGAGCARRARRRLAAPRPHRYGPPRAGSPPPLTARRRVGASGTPPRDSPPGSEGQRSPLRGGAVRCGAGLASPPEPAGGERRAGGCEPPSPPAPPLFHRSGCARSALGGRGGAGDVDGVWVAGGWGWGTKRGDAKRKARRRLLCLGRMRRDPPFAPWVRGDARRWHKCGVAAREALLRDLGTALRPSVAQGSRRARCSLPSWWLSGAQAAGARGQGLGCFGNREQHGAGRAASPPNRAS